MEGSFKAGLLNGFNKCSWHKLSSYHGNWVDGLPHGFGVYSTFNRSYAYAGAMSRGLVAYKVNQFKLEIVPPTLPANLPAADAKNDKKKKPAPSTKNAKAKEEVVVIGATVAPGNALGELVVLLPPEPVVDNNQSQHQLPNPNELCRHIRVSVRAFNPLNGEIGEKKMIWLKRNTPEDIASEWHRFPVNSCAVVNGINKKDVRNTLFSNQENRKIVFSKEESSGLICCSAGNDHGDVCLAVKPSSLHGANEQITYVVDFKLSAETLM